MYNGSISMVWHAVDKRTGITLALKIYKRCGLNRMVIIIILHFYRSYHSNNNSNKK